MTPIRKGDLIAIETVHTVTTTDAARHRNSTVRIAICGGSTRDGVAKTYCEPGREGPGRPLPIPSTGANVLLIPHVDRDALIEAWLDHTYPGHPDGSPMPFDSVREAAEFARRFITTAR